MIVSISRRTDIPAFYIEWLLNRLREGFAMVRNPMNPKQVRRVDLTPEAVEGIVFWTKNAAPMLDHLRDIAAYTYVVQFTMTGYGREIEPGLPELGQRIQTFQRLSEAIGRERVIWRYDPIFLNDANTLDAHCERFAWMAERLCGYTNVCTFSFMDFYQSIQKNMAKHQMRICEAHEMQAIAEAFAKIAAPFQMKLQTCAEAIDLQAYGIGHGCCVDASMFGLGDRPRDPNQRSACRCAPSVDIGAYNTCAHGCVYCYANHSGTLLAKNRANYDVEGAFLT